MKKWGILGLVILFGLLMFLRFLSKKAEAPSNMPPVTPPEEAAGVALPPGATAQTMAETPIASSYVSGAGDYNDLMLPKMFSKYDGACKGASLEEMRATHGRYWGYFAKYSVLTPEENKKLYEYTADYVACSALARNDSDMCGALPGEAEADGIKVDSRMSVSDKCKKRADPVLFLSYLAGKVKSSNSCYAVVSGWKPKILAKISMPALCDAASKGIIPTREYALSVFPDQKRKIMSLFPDSKSSCGGDAECLASFALYSAIKDGNASECPAAKAAFCEAVITKSPSGCETIVKDMSKYYCRVIARGMKVTNGRLGMSPDEIKADIAKVEEDKKYKETQKKEVDKITEELNKRIKDMKKGK